MKEFCTIHAQIQELIHGAVEKVKETVKGLVRGTPPAIDTSAERPKDAPPKPAQQPQQGGDRDDVAFIPGRFRDECLNAITL